MGDPYRFHVLLSTPELCDYLGGVHQRTIRRWRTQRSFPAPIIGWGRHRYLKDDVDRWLDLQRGTGE